MIWPTTPPSQLMRGLYSRFDAARAGWDFPEGTCVGYQEYPSDPVSNGLGSKTDRAGVNVLDNSKDLAVKVYRRIYTQNS